MVKAIWEKQAQQPTEGGQGGGGKVEEFEYRLLKDTRQTGSQGKEYVR